MSSPPSSVHPVPDFTGKRELYHWGKRLQGRARDLWPKKIIDADSKSQYMGVMLSKKMFVRFEKKNPSNKWKVHPDGTVRAWDDPTLVIWNIYNPYPE